MVPTALDEAARPARRLRPAHLLQLLFLLAGLALLASGRRTPAVQTFSLLFASIVLEGLPFMLLGAAVGGLVEVFVSRARMAALLPRRRGLAIVTAAAMGFLFPVCECAVVPVVRRLARKGLPPAVALAYLMGAPIANPIVAFSTAVAYRLAWPVVIARIAGGYAVAAVLALAADRLLRGRAAYAEGVEAPADGRGEDGCGCGHPHGPGAMALPGRVGEALRHAADDLVEVGPWFVIGAAIAAAAQAFLDRGLLLSLAARPVPAILVMMLLAVALNLCSEADAFVAASFRGLVPTSAQLAFLLLGPILDLKLLLMLQALLRRRVIAALAAGMVVVVLAAALGLQAWGGLPP